MLESGGKDSCVKAGKNGFLLAFSDGTVHTLLKINEQRVKEINTEFAKYFNESDIPLLISRKDELNKFRINQDIKILYIIRTLIAKTIVILDINYTNMRVNDYKFELDSYLYGKNATEEVLNIYNKTQEEEQV